MKVSVKWLKEYIDINVSPVELANRLTMAGNEVKEVKTIGGNWENIVVGEVLEVNPHPNADRLRLATVNLGQDKQVVVCGAPNLSVGQKIAFASVGALVFDGHNGQYVKLKPAKIRGVESMGMVCSEKELGISDSHEGIMVLPAGAPVGMALKDYIGDSIIDLEVTPNRPDCLSVIGIAREAAALLEQKTHIVEPAFHGSVPPVEKEVSVEILDPDLCPRYCATLVHGVKIKPSPAWMQERLLACGMRPINNIVDITNYVMLEYGQPLHSFDFKLIQGNKILVRRAKPGETIISLDGVERKLTPEMLVIADANRAVAVAGVMGGANSEVSEYTTSILLEAASFKPTSIHATGEALGLPSEARYRFERGIAAQLTIPAIQQATRLIVELGEGQADSGVIDIYPGKKQREPIALSVERLRRLLGADFTVEQIVKTLSSLGFECQVKSDTQIEAVAPYWRSDIRIEEDLIEEVARVIGYDKIPNTLLGEPLPRQNPDPIFALMKEVRSGFTAYGFTEIMNFSLTGMEMLKKLSSEMQPPAMTPVRVANPMTAEMEYLRLNFRANVLAAFAANRRYEDGGIRLFEMGRVYLPRQKDLPEERESVCGVMGGLRFAKSWQDNDKVLDFFDARGMVQVLGEKLGLSPVFEQGKDESLHPNKQAAVILDGKQVGVLGEVHPKVAANFEISEPVYLVELDLRALLPFTTRLKNYQAIPRFPAIIRDIALVVDTSVTHEQIKKIISGFSLVEKVEVFDVYAGESIPAGKKSMAYRITFLSPAHTLTDDEVNKVLEQVISRLTYEIGANLRS